MNNHTSTPYKRLWRSRTDRKIAGVCGGLGEYFQIDPLWIRILFVVFFLVGGTAFVAYLILWLLVPVEPFSNIKSSTNYNNSQDNFRG